VRLECLTIDSHKLISQLKAEILSWKSAYGKHLLTRASEQCATLSIDLVEHLTFLQQPISTIEDYIACTQRTSELRADETGWKMRLQPIARAQELLGLALPEAEVKALQAIQQQWSELQSYLHTTSHRLVELRPRFHAEYLEHVKTWRQGVKGLKQRWDSAEEGPFVSDLQPTVAAKRLELFQAEYDRSSLEWRSWQHLARFSMAQADAHRRRSKFLERMSRELVSGRDPARTSAEEDSTRSFPPVEHDLVPSAPADASERA
jgi:hypothetical protein